ncbi:uncharacterized protein LOC143852651 isoform X2 [Tasmannia lanceolata]|uniref:uncharacterized protein LOC143852651 isoform X2 n=1 Tax=Tasmannia lanceolata TaxID=3420 RepID=UPI0040640B0C
MPENPAAGEEDEGFGDFKFVSYPSTSLHSNHNPKEEDDEWGDFIENPLQFSQIRPPNTLSFDPFPTFQKPILDPIFPESNPTHHELEINSAPLGVEKIMGALPLSIFGEEEEEPSSIDPSLDALDGFSLKPAAKNGSSFVGLNDLIANLYGQTEQIRAEKEQNFNDDFDEDGWEFKDAFSGTPNGGGDFGVGIENGSNAKLVDGIANFSTSDVDSSKKEWNIADLLGAELKEVKEPMSNGDIQGMEKKLEDCQRAPQLYAFSNGKLDSFDLSNAHDGFFHKPTPTVGNGINGFDFSSGIAPKDIMPNLYSQTEQTSAANSNIKPAGSGFSSVQLGLHSNLANNDDDVDENCWEFKDALSEIGVENVNTGLGTVDMYRNISTESKLEKIVHFYSRLKEKSHFLSVHHLEDLKGAKDAAILSREEAKAMALNEQIQSVYEKLQAENTVYGKNHQEKHPPRNIGVNELLEVVKDPDFHALELEYCLSKRISLSEEDLTSAVGLYEHAISMLHIMTLGSMLDQSTYISAWSKMISVCARELQHGAMIWMQSLQNNVHAQIFSQPRVIQACNILLPLEKYIEWQKF